LKTYEIFYQNEVRAVTISIRDQDDNIWVPTSASSWVVDSVGNLVVGESTATVLSNSVTCIIGTTVTTTAGLYEIIWKISRVSGDTTYIYYHKTSLSVEEL
jgi:hypothetical protein